MKKVFVFLFFLFLFPQQIHAQGNNLQKEERIEATVISVQEDKQITINNKKQQYQKLELLVTTGNLKGKKIIIEQGATPSVYLQEYTTGDTVIITKTKDNLGKDVYYIADYVRRMPLFILFFLFVCLTILVGRKRGLAALLGMGISFFVIFSFILPKIQEGYSPVFITILASLFIVPVTFYLSHGINKKTTTAIIGTFIALSITGVMAIVFVHMGKLSGFTSDEANFLLTINHTAINMQGLLLAGIIIGVVGILDDITISQAAIVYQLKSVSPRLPFGQLYGKAMDIGKDHIASMVNTLILVYTGAAMPLLLLFINNPLPFTDVINTQIIAEEIIRTLVASIGLILAVPITTLISCIAVDDSLAK